MNYLESPKTNSHQIANQLLNHGRLNESKKILTELLSENPSDHVATHMFGLLAKKQAMETRDSLFYEGNRH